jgi:diguanylate cyclase (GGDEF)-like protein
MFARFNISNNHIFRVGLIYAVSLVVLVVMTGYLSGVLRQSHYQHLQLDTVQRLSSVSAKLQGIVNNNLSLISGLAAHIAIDTEIQQEGFERYVKSVFNQESILINMAAAPDLVVTMVYPLEGNRKVLGLDYLKNTEQSAVVERVRNTGDMIVAGPVELVQGGVAFIGRKAVYTEDKKFWGIVSAPIDAEALYQLAGLKDKTNGIHVAIDGIDGRGVDGGVFFGDAALFEDPRSSRIEIALGDGKWLLAAEPDTGWDTIPDKVLLLYASSGGVFLLLSLITFVQARQIISEKHYRRKLHYQAVYDQLTGLPNRLSFDDSLEEAILIASRDNLRLAVFFIDLDNFKAVNDNLGHKAGDELLKLVAGRIKACTRESDTVARYSGDEFMAIIPRVEKVNNLDTIAGNILSEIAKPYNLGTEQVYCTASIGISLYPDDALTIEELISKSDQAMYQAKNSGRNNSQYFTKEMQVHSEGRHQLYNRLVSALVNKSLEVYYQPIVSLEDGSITKCEALVRWFDGEEQVNTADFVKLAEETGVINDIDRFVLETSVEFLMAQSKRLGVRQGLSVNLSPRLFAANDNSLEEWFEIVSKAIKVIDITVEITERLLTEESPVVFDVLTKLKTMGVSIAIDDFGTGYSSLSYLIKFPIDIIKIDRSFIIQLGGDEKAEVLVEAVIGLSRKLSMHVVAEGVENDEQLAYLRQWGCDYCQGYYFSKPISHMEYASLLNDKAGT